MQSMGWVLDGDVVWNAAPVSGPPAAAIEDDEMRSSPLGGLIKLCTGGLMGAVNLGGLKGLRVE